MAIMYSFNDLKDKVRRYFRFSREETKAIIISILVYGFIISFRGWGGDKFNPVVGLGNLIIGILIMTLTILIHVSAQRVSALHVGFRPEYKLWIYGIIISLILAIVSNGVIWFLFLPGGIFLHMLSQHRLGYFRYGLNLHAHALVAFMGPIANITIAILFKIFQLIFPTNLLIQKVILVNVLFAVFSMLPIPPLDGSRMFYYSRMSYAFTYGILIGISLFLVSNVGILLSLAGSLVLGFIVWLAYYVVFERNFMGA